MTADQQKAGGAAASLITGQLAADKQNIEARQAGWRAGVEA